MRYETRRARGRGRGRAVRAAALLAAAVVGIGVEPVWAEVVTANWKSAAPGNWADASRWTTDPAFPSNGDPQGTTYHAMVNASGIGYTVTLDRGITVDAALLDAPNASSVNHADGTFTTFNGLELKRGSWRVSGGAQLGSDVKVLGPSAGLIFENSLPFNHTISLVDDATLSFAVDQTFSGTAEIIFDSTLPERKSGFIRGSNLTIGPGVSIRTGVGNGNGSIGRTSDALTNQGLISASGGGAVSVTGNGLVNHGTIEVVNGANLTLVPMGASSNTGTIRATSGSTLIFGTNGGTWNNSGTLHLADSTLVLGGHTVSASLTAGLTRAGDSRVLVAGRVENAGSTLSLDAFGAPWSLGYASIPVVGLSTTAEIRGGQLGTPGESGTLPVSGYAELVGVTNNLNLDVSQDTTLVLQGNTANTGSISATGARLVVRGNPTSLGAMALTDSKLELGLTDPFAPLVTTSVTTAQLSQIDLTRSRIQIARGATLDNSGGTIEVVSGNPLQVAGGTIKNGAINIATGAVFGTAGGEESVLDNVAVTGNPTLDNGTLSFRNGSTWTGDRVTIDSSTKPTKRLPAIVFGGDVTWDEPVEIVLARGDGYIGTTTGTFTLNSDVTIRKQTGDAQAFGLGTERGNVINRGRVFVDNVTAGLSSAFAQGSVTNEGLIEVRGSAGQLNFGQFPFTNYANRKLSGGRWHVYDGARLVLTRFDPIEINAAEIVISGPASGLAGAPLGWLKRNEGSLSFLNGQVHNVDALENVGYVKVDRQSVMTARGKLDSTAGRLDTDGLVIVTGTAETRAALLESVVQQILAARNSAEGRWKGKGITSSAAAANPLTGLAAFVNDDGRGGAIIGTKYGTVTPDPNSIIIGHAYNGDANFDGRINADDYFRIDQGFLAQPSEPTWHDGDFNYDGTVNADDYFLIDQAFLGQREPIGGAVTALAAVAVPEPAIAAVLCMGSLLIRRRRRR